MDKINVNILFSDNYNTETNNNSGVLDVNTLANIKSNNDTSFNIDSLIKIRKEKREKLLETYIKYYNRCIEKIKVLNNRNITDMFFEVPLTVPDCYGYKPVDCIEFISNKLNVFYMDTYKINNHTLFITWKYIEANKESDNRRKQ
ncbi:hypothetical protein Catovirus_2_296 [Catovirus CTV1]|uniref:Uncharacterized protein n=1 Tax=Catovirus CTV1 TaxID=1977631 RepID=A0A1V0SCB3_9VIRU|nr:hypothetical protein Catovirus_2_296 [Catovirus CTV1]